MYLPGIAGLPQWGWNYGDALVWKRYRERAGLGGLNRSRHVGQHSLVRLHLCGLTSLWVLIVRELNEKHYIIR